MNKTEIELLAEQNEILKTQNKILSRNTIYTGFGFLVGFVALVIALIAFFK